MKILRKEQEETFQNLARALTAALVLAFSKIITIQVESLPYSIQAVLTQKHEVENKS